MYFSVYIMIYYIAKLFIKWADISDPLANNLFTPTDYWYKYIN